MVMSPALAESSDLSNFRPALSSATIFSALLSAGGVAEAVVAGAPEPPVSAVESSLSSPHAAIVRVSAIAPTAHTVLAAFSIVSSPSRSFPNGTRGAVDPSRVPREGSQGLTRIAVTTVVAVALCPERGLRAIGDAQGPDHDREGAVELGRLEPEALGEHPSVSRGPGGRGTCFSVAGSRASRRGSR